MIVEIPGTDKVQIFACDAYLAYLAVMLTLRGLEILEYGGRLKPVQI